MDLQNWSPLRRLTSEEGRELDKARKIVRKMYQRMEHPTKDGPPILHIEKQAKKLVDCISRFKNS